LRIRFEQIFSMFRELLFKAFEFFLNRLRQNRRNKSDNKVAIVTVGRGQRGVNVVPFEFQQVSQSHRGFQVT